MTKKDYIKIAAVFANFADAPTDKVTQGDAMFSLAQAMASMLEQENPRFDRARFLAACGVTP